MYVRSRGFGWAIASVLLILAPFSLSFPSALLPATAQTARDWKAEADRLLKEGEAQLNGGKNEAALPLLEQALKLYQELSNHAGVSQALKSLGNVYSNLQQYEKAIAYYQQSLMIAREIKNQDLEARSLHNLGLAYAGLKKTEEAIAFYQQSLAASRTSQNWVMIELTTVNLGELYKRSQKYSEAIALYQQAELLFREAKDKSKEAQAIGLIGDIYFEQQHYEQAIAYYQQTLPLFQQVQDRNGEAIALMTLGNAYRNLSQYEKAITYYQQALPLFQQAQNRNGEAYTLNNLGNAYNSLSQYDKAITYYQQSLQVAEEIQNRELQITTILNIANASYQVASSPAEYQKVIELTQRGLKLAQTENNHSSAARALVILGNTYNALKDYPKAIEFLQQSIAVAQEAKEKWREAAIYNDLANVYMYSLNDYPKSIKFDRQALTIHRELKNFSGEADSLRNIGLAYGNLVDYPKALDYFQQALAIDIKLGNSAGEGTSLGYIGKTYNNLEQPQKALAFHQQALVIFRNLKNSWGEAAVLTDLGITYSNLSQFQQAIELYQKALEINRKLSNTQAEAYTLVNQSESYLALGQFKQGIEAAQQSVAIFQRIGDRNGEATALTALGSAYYFTGEYQQTIILNQQSLELYRKLGNQYGEVNALINLGNVYHALGQYPQSIEAEQEALTIARQLGIRSTEAVAISNQGFSYNMMGQYQKALELHQQSLAIAREIGNRYLEANALVNIGFDQDKLKQYSQALDTYQQALAITREIDNPRYEGYLLDYLGNVYQALKQPHQAEELYQKSLAIARDIGDREREGRVLNSIASLYAEQNQPDLAIIFYKQSVNVRESIRQNFRKLSHEQQESYTQTVAGTYRALADLLLAQGRVLEAQQVLELLKIQELRDYTRDTRTGGTTQGTTLNPLEQPIPAAYNDKIALGNQLTQCEQQKCPQRSQLIAQREAANDKFTILVDRLKKLLREQEIKDPAQLQSNEFTRAAQDVILANPNTKTVLIYPLVLDDKLWLVWGSQAGKAGIVFDSKEIPVTRKQLSATVGELQTLLSNRNSNLKDLQKVSQQLYQWLIAPIRPQLEQNGVKQIVFSLDRATRYIPMAALHDGKQYLIENFAISTILTAKTDTYDKLSANIQDDPVLGLGVTQAVPGFAPLPAVKAELDGIIRIPNNPQDSNGIYPGLELFDRDFTETALREKVSDYRILHIATHGQFVPGNPEDSFLVMSDGKKLSIPTIRSITALANTHLVVLSACETGKGGVDKEGLEVAGIGHYFLLSGAKSVMASLWLVNDPATSLLMRRFYQNLSQGNISKAEALRQSQLDFIQGKLTVKDTTDRAGSRRYIEGQPSVDSLAHPYYWAPFILIGNSL
ncbi:MAG: hypothetical protein Fur006_10320 [Coleofasciculaceae cyanobacterium]